MNAFMRFISRGLPMRFRNVHVRTQASTPGSIVTTATTLQPLDRVILPSRSKTHVVARVERLAGYMLVWNDANVAIAMGYEDPVCIIRPKGPMPPSAASDLELRARKAAEGMGESWAHHPANYQRKLSEPRGI